MTPSWPSGAGKVRLDAMIEEATVDCYNEDEQLTGMFTMIEDNLALPFETRCWACPSRSSVST